MPEGKRVSYGQDSGAVCFGKRKVGASSKALVVGCQPEEGFSLNVSEETYSAEKSRRCFTGLKLPW